MSTQLSATRSAGRPITLDEWLGYLATRTDIEVPDASVRLSTALSKYVDLKNPGFGRLRLPHGDRTGRLGLLNLRDGSIVFEYLKGDIDEHATSEMRVIAAALDAELLERK